ncbi:MAG: hypothetical protein HFJ37_00710 [Clostridia bacterium]|nr:hypothetical protein [Clostridia bacterium]
MAIVTHKNFKVSIYFINTKKLTAEYDNILLDNQVIIVALNGKKGVYSYEGKCLLSVEHFNIIPTEKFLIVHLDDDKTQGVYSYTGIEILPPKYSHLRFFYNFIEVGLEEKKGIYSFKGNMIIPVGYNFIEYNFSNKVIKVRTNHKEGLFSFDGKLILPVIFDKIYIWDDDSLFQVVLNRKMGLFSFDGKLILPIIFDKLDSYKHSFISLHQNGKEGLFSIENRTLIIPCIYSKITFYQNIILGDRDLFDMSTYKQITSLTAEEEFITCNEFYIVIYNNNSSNIVILQKSTLEKKCSVTVDNFSTLFSKVLLKEDKFVVVNHEYFCQSIVFTFDYKGKKIKTPYPTYTDPQKTVVRSLRKFKKN